MKQGGENGKSCGPQLFDNGKPSNEWKLEDLSVYAQEQYRQILDGEKLLLPAYWRLSKRTGDMTRDAKTVKPEECVDLIPALYEAIDELIDLLDYLRKQAEAAPVDRKRSG
jgi:hypothetical protein